jgi:hypothetical protein
VSRAREINRLADIYTVLRTLGRNPLQVPVMPAQADGVGIRWMSMPVYEGALPMNVQTGENAGQFHFLFGVSPFDGDDVFEADPT